MLILSDRFRSDLGGAEQKAMHGALGQLFGKYSEEMFFEGDQHPLNPARYLPTPFHTKFAQQRTALSQYLQQEAVGTRMRRWERPVHDFLAPYFRGMAERLTGENILPPDVRRRRDLDTVAGQGQTPGPSPRASPLPDLQSAPALLPAQSGNSRGFSYIRPTPGRCSSALLQPLVAHRFRVSKCASKGTMLRGEEGVWREIKQEGTCSVARAIWTWEGCELNSYRRE
jgi:hypothetical protein